MEGAALFVGDTFAARMTKRVIFTASWHLYEGLGFPPLLSLSELTKSETARRKAARTSGQAIEMR